MRSIIHIIGVSSAACLIALLNMHVARPTWAVLSQQALRPPCPAIDANPLSLRGSPLGLTISQILMESAENAHHLGMTHVNLPVATPAAGFMDKLTGSLIPRARCEHPDHSHANHSEERISSFSEEAVRKAVKLAYLLDPANVSALETYVGWVEHTQGDAVSLIDSNGFRQNLPIGRWRGIQLCEFSLPRFDCLSGLRPEACLARARTRQIWWNARFGQSNFDTETAEERRARLRELANVRDDVRQLNALARQQQQILVQVGLWQVRPPQMREKFERSLRESAAFVRASDRALSEKVLDNIDL